MSSKLQNLPVAASIADTDILYEVATPGGTPTDKQVAFSVIKNGVLAAQNWTRTTSASFGAYVAPTTNTDIVNGVAYGFISTPENLAISSSSLITATGLPVGSAARTLAFWFYPVGGGQSGLVGWQGNGGGESRFGVYIDNSNNLKLHTFADTLNIATVNTNAWNLIIITYSVGATTAKAYFNGAAAVTLTLSSALNTGGQTLHMGGFVFGLTSLIDEVEIWNRALTSGEATTLWNSGAGDYGNVANPPFNSGLVSGWHLDEGGGNTLYDYVGSNNLPYSGQWVTGQVVNPSSTPTATPPMIDFAGGAIQLLSNIGVQGNATIAGNIYGNGRTILGGITDDGYSTLQVKGPAANGQAITGQGGVAFIDTTNNTFFNGAQQNTAFQAGLGSGNHELSAYLASTDQGGAVVGLTTAYSGNPFAPAGYFQDNGASGGELQTNTVTLANGTQAINAWGPNEFDYSENSVTGLATFQVLINQPGNSFVDGSAIATSWTSTGGDTLNAYLSSGNQVAAVVGQTSSTMGTSAAGYFVDNNANQIFLATGVYVINANGLVNFTDLASTPNVVQITTGTPSSQGAAISSRGYVSFQDITNSAAQVQFVANNYAIYSGGTTGWTAGYFFSGAFARTVTLANDTYAIDIKGAINTDQSVAAPNTTATPVFTSYYGGNTKAMGDPVGWITISVSGTPHKVPYY